MISTILGAYSGVRSVQLSSKLGSLMSMLEEVSRNPPPDLILASYIQDPELLELQAWEGKRYYADSFSIPYRETGVSSLKVPFFLDYQVLPSDLEILDKLKSRHWDCILVSLKMELGHDDYFWFAECVFLIFEYMDGLAHRVGTMEVSLSGWYARKKGRECRTLSSFSQSCH